VVVPLVPARTVDVSFDSTPRGAETRIVGQETLLGLTPFHHSFPAGESEIEVEMRVSGFMPRRDRFALTEDRMVGGRLRRPVAQAMRKKDVPPGAEEPAAPKPKVTRGTTLNPFDD
jgi:hypothetical protein